MVIESLGALKLVRHIGQVILVACKNVFEKGDYRDASAAAQTLSVVFLYINTYMHYSQWENIQYSGNESIPPRGVIAIDVLGEKGKQRCR